MSNYNATLRAIRSALEAKLRASDPPWTDEALKGMRNVTKGRRSRQSFHNLRFAVGEPIQRDGEAVQELPFLVFEAFDFPQSDGQPGDVRIYCAPLPEARQQLEQALLGGPYEGAACLRFDINRSADAQHAPGGQNLTELAFIEALADEWQELHDLYDPPEEEADGEDEERECQSCGATTRTFEPDDEDEDADAWLQPTFCGRCGQQFPVVAEVVSS